MWSISSLEPTERDLDVRRATKAQDARLDARTRQQPGRRKRGRLKGPSGEESLEVDVFEHAEETEDSV
jgi:hypothetical protein